MQQYKLRSTVVTAQPMIRKGVVFDAEQGMWLEFGTGDWEITGLPDTERVFLSGAVFHTLFKREEK